MTKENLLPEECIKILPSLNDTAELTIDEQSAYIKYFYPDFNWTWYVMAYDGDDLFFGLVDGDVCELGYFTLSELMSNRGKLGCPIERDLYFKPKPVKNLMR